MTLEQIKSEQQNLNTRLLSILDGLTQTTSKITGDFTEPKSVDEELLPNGLLNEIRNEQKQTSELLDLLADVGYRLSEHTYAPSQTV